MTMAIRITDIFRYPVKGLSAERLGRTSLKVADCLPHDRRFALALASTAFDAARPEWMRKTHFVMLMRDEILARLRTRFDETTGTFTISQNGQPVLSARITEPDGKRAVGEFFAEFLKATIPDPPRVVEAAGHTFSDARQKPNSTTFKYVSLINRASIRALERAAGGPVDPIRFRANLYFEGASEWVEHDWVGSEITVGSARMRVVSRTIRCAATQVNPQTAERDLDVPALLEQHFGHTNLGIYGEVTGAGDVAENDLLVPPARTA
jgi:uncharacterized protein YcbX